jgi:hypothetical protein
MPVAVRFWCGTAARKTRLVRNTEKVVASEPRWTVDDATSYAESKLLEAARQMVNRGTPADVALVDNALEAIRDAEAGHDCSSALRSLRAAMVGMRMGGDFAKSVAADICDAFDVEAGFSLKDL